MTGDNQFTIVPKTYLETLRERATGFKYLDENQQIRLASIFSKYFLSDRYQHRNGEGIFYPKTVLEEQFGRDYRKIMRKFFQVDDKYRYNATDPKDNYTKRYQIKTGIGEIVNEFLKTRTNQQNEILVNGKPFRNGNAVSSRDINGNMKKSSIKLPNITRINVDNLHDLSVYLSRAYDTILEGGKPRKSKFSHITGDLDRIEYYIRIVNELLRLSNVKPIPHGYMPAYYRETSTGRLQAQGVHLQNIPKVIRLEAVRGLDYWQYDFENCHYSVLEQLSKNELPTVRYYNTHKNEFRSTIADDLGVSIKQVKTALISVIYGASDKKGYTISDIFGDETESFLNHAKIQGLFDDIKTARKQIINDMPVSRARIMNAMGKGISVDEDPKTILAHILQGIEANMLQSAIENDLQSVKLLLFDGWYSDKELNVLELENKVLSDTGFKVKIEAEKLHT